MSSNEKQQQLLYLKYLSNLEGSCKCVEESGYLNCSKCIPEMKAFCVVYSRGERRIFAKKLYNKLMKIGNQLEFDFGEE